MSRFLVIGVGDGGRNAVKHMKDVGIPEADYITFGNFSGNERQDIPNYNLITMNGFCGLPRCNDPMLFKRLAENVGDEIREIIKYHINGSNKEDKENKDT